jgi:hypothetical protein
MDKLDLIKIKNSSQYIPTQQKLKTFESEQEHYRGKGSA